jgi:hypothetical protein
MTLRKLSDEESRDLEDALSQNGLPFENMEEAEKYFFELRDKDLTEIRTIGEINPELKLDFRAQSLLRLEDFYFKAYVDKSIAIEIEKDRFEELLSQYMRQVFVTNEMAEWMVFENDFAEGRYDLGIMYGYGAGGTEHYASDLDKTEKDSNRKRLYNSFMLYVPEGREKDVQ